MTTTGTIPELRTDIDTLRAFWGVLVRPGDVHEVRAPKTRGRWRGVTSGCFNDVEAACQGLKGVSGAEAEALYVTLNPIKSALLARAANRLKENARETTSDADILRRTTLLIDCDPVRPSGISATDAERDAALALRDTVRAYLSEEAGWPSPLAITMSGNGGGLLYRVDLPNDEESTHLVTGILRALAHLFDTPDVKVDTANFNAARITKVVGTVAAKGDNIPERPWRVATGTVNPEAPMVSPAALACVAALAPRPQRHVGHDGQHIDLRARLTRAEIGWREKTKPGYTILQLDRCLTSTDHADGAALFQFASGAVAYRCLHNRCSEKRWEDVRYVLRRGEAEDHPGVGENDTDKSSTDKKRPTQAEILVNLADQATLFHTPDGETGYAICEVDGHAETWPLRSKGFKRWLLQQFYKKEGKPPGAQAVADALGTLEARAHYDGSEFPVYVRLAEHHGNIYLDLADEQWRAVEITPDGWRVVVDVPVRFRRPKGMLPLPVPERGGDLKVLRQFVNVTTEGDWQLYLGFCLAALRPAGPYPLLIQHGEQGTAKTTNSRVLRSLLDPNISAVRAEPSDVRDIMVAAHNSWCLAFDNLSHLPDWLSDAFCRLATGGGFSTRELYTDQDEMIFEAQRPVILNGIEELATRGDLLDRSIILYLPRIEEKLRKPERGFWRDFEEAHPRFLGALLDVVSAGLRNLPDIQLHQHPRMADFARWITACEPALGWETESFLQAYTSNRAAAHDLTLDASPITGPVRDLAERSGEHGWQGTSSDLLDLLNHPRPKDTKPPNGWPKSPRGLSNALRRLAPSLLAIGVEIILPTEKTREARTRRRLLTIRKSTESCGPSVPTGPTNEETVTYAGTIGGTMGPQSESFRPQGTERGPVGTQAELFRPPVNISKHKAGDDRDDGDDKIASLSNGWEEV